MSRTHFIRIIWIAFFISIVVFTFFNEDKSITSALLSFAVSLLYTIVIGFGNDFLNKALSKKFSWVEQTRIRVILGIAGTILINVVLVFFCNYVNFIIIQKNDPDNFFSGSMGLSNWVTINVALLVSAILHAKSFMEEWKKSARKEVVEQKLIAKSANAQFESLKNQLDPHFLFNSLNVLSSLIDENPAQAQRFTSSMSKIYRYVLEQKDKELVTVEEELEFAKTYCNLLKTRFEDSVNFEFLVDEIDKKGFVVPLSLQLLLENCIKHNFATSAKPLMIKIYTEAGNLIIENNLQAREQVKESAGIGLANIVQRYALLTKQNVFIEKSADFFKVKIPILTQKVSTVSATPSNEMLAYNRASERVNELKGFYGHVIAYCLVIPLLIFINLRTIPEHQWFWWPMLAWGTGLASHALKTFGIGKNWEEQQVRKILNKEKK